MWRRAARIWMPGGCRVVIGTQQNWGHCNLPAHMDRCAFHTHVPQPALVPEQLPAKTTAGGGSYRKR